MSANPGRLLHASNLSLFKPVHAAPDSENAQATTKIDGLGPATTFHRIASEIKFNEKIAKVEAASRSEGQTDTNDDEIEKEHGYSLDICQLV